MQMAEVNLGMMNVVRFFHGGRALQRITDC